MNVFDKLWSYILSLFGKRPVDLKAEKNNSEYREKYEDISRISFESILATSISKRAVSDSAVSVKDAAGKDSRRSEWIADGLRCVWSKKESVVAQALGKGGKVLIPYVVDGKACVDSIDQFRMRITSVRGGEITGASIIADMVHKDGRPVYRLVDYSLEGRVHTIQNRAATENGDPVELSEVPEWAGIAPEIVINNVDHILFGFLKCPTDSRKDAQQYGVPITYGADDIIMDLYTCLDDMRQEYRLKKPFVGVDDRMFGKNNQLPQSGLFKRFSGTGLKDDNLWEVYDPAIRDSSYLARFQQLCGLLESAVGVSPGILTEPRTGNATATEIKQANAETFAYIDAVRSNIEEAFSQLAYALDVLAEFCGATPAGTLGDWQIFWDWDMSMMEASTETFNQLSELESRHLLLPERLVAWVTGMDLDAAKKEVEAAQALQPNAVDELLMEE